MTEASEELFVNNLEPEWLAKVEIGNPDAFADLVEYYQRPVYNLCYRMLYSFNTIGMPLDDKISGPSLI